MPPVIEGLVPVFVEFHEGSVFSLIVLVESLVHEEVQFIATVEVATSLTWAWWEFNHITVSGDWVECH